MIYSTSYLQQPTLLESHHSCQRQLAVIATPNEFSPTRRKQRTKPCSHQFNSGGCDATKWG